MGSRLALHPPPAHRQALQRMKAQRFHQQANPDDRQQTCKDLVGVQLVAILKDLPAQPALPGGRPKHQFGCNQRAPCKGPANLQP